MLNDYKKLPYKTKYLRIGFDLRCASQRATQCDSVIVNYSELNDYLLVVYQFQFAINVLFYCEIVLLFINHFNFFIQFISC